MTSINNAMNAVDISGMYEAARCAENYIKNFVDPTPITIPTEEVSNRPAAW